MYGDDLDSKHPERLGGGGSGEGEGGGEAMTSESPEDGETQCR